ncbi:MAG: hypothetical protein HC875_15265 [Anaerolineales bacterium]|nr:hypothetical protein [Anaerolineales bacterium]
MADYFFIMDAIDSRGPQIDFAREHLVRGIHYFDFSQDLQINETQMFFTPFAGNNEPTSDPGSGTCIFSVDRNSFYDTGFNSDQVSSSIGQFLSPISGCTPNNVPFIFGEKTNYVARRSSILYRLTTK